VIAAAAIAVLLFGSVWLAMRGESGVDLEEEGGKMAVESALEDPLTSATGSLLALTSTVQTVLETSDNCDAWADELAQLMDAQEPDTEPTDEELQLFHFLICQLDACSYATQDELYHDLASIWSNDNVFHQMIDAFGDLRDFMAAQFGECTSETYDTVSV
jgi:hypothetical protein